MIRKNACWSIIIGTYIVCLIAFASSFWSCAAFTPNEMMEITSIQQDIDSLVNKISTGELTVQEGLEKVAEVRLRLEKLKSAGYSFTEILIAVLASLATGGVVFKSPGFLSVLAMIFGKSEAVTSPVLAAAMQEVKETNEIKAAKEIKAPKKKVAPATS